MELRHLIHFVALAETKQFTAAARRVNVVQSGLSVTIKELEEEIGSMLVDRTTRSVALTEAGECFLEYARSSLSSLHEGIVAVRSQDGIVRGRLKIGILQSLTPYVDLPVVLQRFRATYPQVEFAVRAVDTDEVPALVRSRDVDLSFQAVGERTTLKGLETIPFARDVLVAVCSKRSDLATRRSVNLESISTEQFVDLIAKRALRVLLDHVFLERGLKRSSTYEVSDVETLLQFVSCGLGVAIVPAALVRSSRYAGQLHVLKITQEGPAMPKWRIAIVTRTNPRGSAVTPIHSFCYGPQGMRPYWREPA